MKRDTQWSRRTFLQGIGYTSALAVLRNVNPRIKASVGPCFAATTAVGYAYVTSAEKGSDGSAIHVFEVRDDLWQWKQSIPSRSPAALTLHSDRQVLYVANEVDEHEGLPRGTVEAYRIKANNGTLTLINRQPLSLSGVKPRHLAVSSDGKYLVTTIHGGGAYNILSIEPGGCIGRVTQILKEVGIGPDPIYQASAHPHTVLFDPTGQRFFATDEGCDRINVFVLKNGTLRRTARTCSLPLTGPGPIAMHPSGDLFYVANTLDGSIDRYRWRVDAEEMKHEQRIVENSKAMTRQTRNLAFSSSGRVLYATSNENISAWKVDPITGQLSLIQRQTLKNSSLSALVLSSDTQRLYVADRRQHKLLSIPLHAESGGLGAAFPVAEVAAPTNLIMKYL